MIHKMAQKKMELIRFDWAMKRILRDKANYAVLEGFLSVLLKEKITIEAILGSQANQETQDEKYNDVDILIRNSKDEHVIIEVQNSKQVDYFHRILFGASKIITEYIDKKQAYENVKKVYSVTVAYFDLGQGLDYVYHGTTTFKGIHRGDILHLSTLQRERYYKSKVQDIYPEFWIIKAGIFDEEQVNDELDEWIYFFKTGYVLDNFTAAGLAEARELLDKLKLPKADREAYDYYEERLRKLASYQITETVEIEDFVRKATEKATEKATAEAEVKAALEKENMILGMDKAGLPVSQIAIITQKTQEEVQQIIAKNKY